MKLQQIKLTKNPSSNLPVKFFELVERQVYQYKHRDQRDP